MNLNGFDLALQIALVCFPLPGQRGQTFVRCRACSIHNKLYSKNGSPTEGGGSGSGSPAAGGGGGGGSPEAGAGGRRGEGEGSIPAAGVDGGGDSGSTAAGGGGSPAASAGEAKAKAAALQQAWMEAATAEAHQQS